MALFVPSSQAQRARPVVVLLASDQATYQRGSSVTFTIAADTPGPDPTTLTFGSGQRYDIAVMLGETEVWRWSNDRAFTAVYGEASFRPGLTLLGRETWDWRDNTGAWLQPGTYRIIGSIASSPPQQGNVVEITLAP